MQIRSGSECTMDCVGEQISQDACPECVTWLDVALLKDVLGSDMQHCKLFVLGECVSECSREIAVKMLVGFYMLVVCLFWFCWIFSAFFVWEQVMCANSVQIILLQAYNYLMLVQWKPLEIYEIKILFNTCKTGWLRFLTDLSPCVLCSF